MTDKILQPVEIIRANGGCIKTTERIIKETALTIKVDGKHYATAMIMAAMEKEYVIGHMYTQGAIRRAGDIESIAIQDDTAEVKLVRGQRKPVFTGVRSSLTVSPDDIFSCLKAILKSPVFTETEAVHSAGLFLNGKETVGIAEDLGRHNALDKVIGCGILKFVNFRRTLAVSTGRLPTEMIYKCLQAKIPIIASKGVPTSLGVEIAEKSGITIVGLARGNKMEVYSHLERIK
jgi:FdhD protein